MSKTLFTALLILLLSAAGAGADPISGAIAVIGSLLSTSGLVKLAITVAINVGMGLIEQAKARREARKNQRPSGVTLSIQMGDAQPRSYLIGTRATAGRRIYFGTWGQAGKTPNAYATDVIELSCLPNNAGPQGLEAVWIGDKKVTVLWDQPHPDGRGYPIEGYQQGGGDWLWIKFLDGSQTAADPFLVATFGGHADHPFKSTMIGRGCQVVILTARFNQEFFKSGLPQGLYQPKPMRLYDLRKDSTNGGVGTHRWSDPSTWEASDNLGVMIYNIGRGIYYGGRWVHGGRNFAQHRLPASSWIAALNEADRLISGRKQFRGGLEVFVDQDPLDVIEDLRIGCAGRLAEVGGILKLLIGAPAAAVYSFTDAQIIVTSEQDFEPFPSVSSTHNTITAVYPEPEQKWADKDAPERSSATLLARDDGERLPVPVRFEAVSIVDQVQCLMATMIEEEQRWRIHELVLPPDAAPLEPNDVVAWSSDRNAYSNKKFLVDRAICLPGLLQQVRLKELDPSDYDPPAIIYPPVVGPTGPIEPPTQPAYGFTAVPAVLTDAEGNQRRPSIKVSCASDQDDVVRVWIQVRVKASGQVVYDNDSTPYATPFEWILNGAFLPNTLYQVRLKFIPYTKRETTWADWADVTTPNILLATLDFLNESITAEKIANAAVTAAKIMDEAITALKLADQAVTTAKLEIGAVTQQILAAGSITLEKFIPGLEPITVITGPTLPTTKTTSTVMFEDVLYTWNETSGAYEPPQTGIADGSITAAKLADAAVIASKLATGAVTHDKISAGSIYGDVIAAQAITARELYLTDFENRLPNGGFEEGGDPHTYWTNVSGQGVLVYISAASFPNEVQSGERSLALQKNADAMGGSINVVSKSYIPVIPTEVYHCGTVIKGNDGTASVGAYVRCLWYDAQKVQLVATPYTDAIQNVAISATWTPYSVKVSVPTGAAFMRVQLINSVSQNTARNLIFDRLAVRKANAAQLIVDGSIIATHLAADSVTTDKIIANAIVAGKIAAGAITAQKLAVGLGRNLLSNTEFYGGMAMWEVWNQNGVPNRLVELLPEGSTWALAGQPYTLQIWQSDQNQAAGVLQVNTSKKIPVFPSKKYEFYASLGVHRCEAYAGISWYDANGNGIIDSVGNVIGNVGSGGKSISGYSTSGGIVTSPANAAFAMFYVRKNPTIAGQGNSYVFMVRPYFGQATDNQAAFSDWSPGGVSYIGSDYILTGAIIASKIGASAVTAEKIAAGAIVADKIAAAAITGDKIAANTIGANNIAAAQITARHLILTDYENLVPNGFFAHVSDEYYAKGGDYNSMGLIGPGFSLTGTHSLLLQKKSANMGASINAEWHNNYMFPISMAEYLYCETAAWGNVGTSAAGFYFRLYFYDANRNLLLSNGQAVHGTSYWDVAGNAPILATWQKYAEHVPVPTGAVFAKIQFISHSTNTTAQNVIIDRAVVRRAKGAELIVDGTITANKLNVNNLSAVSANFGDAYHTGYSRSINGKVVIDWNNGNISISD